MANRIVSVHAWICGIGIYAIMLPSSGFSVAYFIDIFFQLSNKSIEYRFEDDFQNQIVISIAN